MEEELVPGPGYDCTQSFPISVYCCTKCDYSDSKFPKWFHCECSCTLTAYGKGPTSEQSPLTDTQLAKQCCYYCKHSQNSSIKTTFRAAITFSQTSLMCWNLCSFKVDFPVLETTNIHWNPNLQRGSVPVQQYITGQLYATN